MKKIISIFLVLLMIVSVMAGCGKKESPSAIQPTTQPPRQTAQTIQHPASERFDGGTGTQEDPYQISQPGHLVLLHNLLAEKEAENVSTNPYADAHYILTADIVLNDTTDFDNWATTAPTYGWTPIGAELTLNTFNGVLDGDGHKISGMFIDADGNQTKTSNDYYGLFAEIKGTVKNLTVDSSYIRVSGNVANVGTIAGYIHKGQIENCHADSIIQLYTIKNAGGICGSGGTISNCTYSGAISQLDDSFFHIGGILGYGGNISGCTFSGTIDGNGYSGGIVGYGGNVKDSTNTGSVSGDTVGGISGRIYAAGTNLELENTQFTIENCVNEGQLTAATLAGGIVGWMGNDESNISITVTNCRNQGAIYCGASMAGIIGKVSVERSGNINITSCANTADISGKGVTGGIIGEMVGSVLHQEGTVTVNECQNTGAIISQDLYSAGILGYLLINGSSVDFDLNLLDCSNEGNVESNAYAGGILGFSNVGFNAEISEKNFSDSTHLALRNCTNCGNVTVNSSNAMAGGIVGVLGTGYIPTDISNCINAGTVRIDFTLSEQQIADSQGKDWTEFFQIGGGIIGRIGDALKLTTAEGVGTSPDNVNTPGGIIKITGCTSTGQILAPDYSFILNKWDKPLYMNYLGGIVGQCSATAGYTFSVTDCAYSGADRGLGATQYPDFGTKK